MRRFSDLQKLDFIRALALLDMGIQSLKPETLLCLLEFGSQCQWGGRFTAWVPVLPFPSFRAELSLRCSAQLGMIPQTPYVYSRPALPEEAALKTHSKCPLYE